MSSAFAVRLFVLTERYFTVVSSSSLVVIVFMYLEELMPMKKPVTLTTFPSYEEALKLAGMYERLPVYFEAPKTVMFT